MEWEYTNMKRFAEQHSEEVVHELITNYVITQGQSQSAEMWRLWCVKHGLCGKGTKYTSLNMHNFQSSGGVSYHMIRVLNGRGQYLINVNISDKELKEYLGE